MRASRGERHTPCGAVVLVFRFWQAENRELKNLWIRLTFYKLGTRVATHFLTQVNGGTESLFFETRVKFVLTQTISAL